MPPMAMPMSALLRAGTSLTPSPVMVTVFPYCCSTETTRILWAVAMPAVPAASASLGSPTPPHPGFRRETRGARPPTPPALRTGTACARRNSRSSILLRGERRAPRAPPPRNGRRKRFQGNGSWSSSRRGIAASSASGYRAPHPSAHPSASCVRREILRARRRTSNGLKITASGRYLRRQASSRC
jgi:hypothetical protein